MLAEIGTVENIPKAMARAKDKNDPFRLMGFGHRVYKSFDPRARVVQAQAKKVLSHLGIDDPLLNIAMRLEEIALRTNTSSSASSTRTSISIRASCCAPWVSP